MPVVTIDVITRPEHLVEYLASLMEDNNLDLGMRTIAKYNERLMPEYPAMIILAGPAQKEFHGTHTFAVTLRADLYILHAKLTTDRQTRSYEDLVMATDVVDVLELSNDLGGRVIHGWVESEIAGVAPPGQTRSEPVISTRMTYQAIQETRFK